MSATDLLAATRRTLAAVDRVLAGFWERVVAALRSLTGAMTQERRRSLMLAVDREVAVVFGATQAAAITAQLFRTLSAELTVTANVPAVRAAQTVKAIVERRDPALWQTIRAKASRESADGFLRVVALTDGPQVDAERMLRARSLDPQRRWVKGKDGKPAPYRLSDRVWRLGKETRTAIDDRLRVGIARGEDALTIADDLVSYLRLDQQPEIITVDGKVIRRRNLTATPGRGGYGSYQARRLARTEVTRVHGQATIEMMRVTPGGKGIRWRLSGSHPEQDICNDHASADLYGLGAGVYPVNSVPPYPNHPMDLCVLVPVVQSRDEVIADVLRRYGGGT